MPTGKTNNPNGRPKGSTSLKVIQWQKTGKELITGGLERAAQIMSDADDDKYMEYFFKLIEYYKPKLQRSDVNQTSEGKVIIEVVRRDDNNSDSLTDTALIPEAGSNGA